MNEALGSISVRFYSSLYFLAQRVRGGVDQGMIAAADKLLAQPWPEVLTWVDERLTELHGTGEEAGLGWLKRQAPVDRVDIRDTLATAGRAAASRRVEWRRTSGSTGAPLTFAKDRRMTAWMDAAMWAAYGWHGVRPGQPHARFWGLPRHPWRRLRRRMMDRMLNRRRLDAFDLSLEESVAFFDGLLRFQPVYIHAYPTLLRSFVEYCAAAGRDGRDLGIRVVICGGELLIDATRSAISEFFGCRVVDEYGCTESGLLTLECEEGSPHVLPVACYPEVVTADAEALTSGVGEVVVSDLFGDVAPLVRYRLSDRARITPPGCPCGRDLPSLKPELGRSQDFITTPQRGRVYATILAYTVPEGIQRFKAYQIRPDAIVAEVVLAADAAPSTAKTCRHNWEEELGDGMSVRLITVAEIPPEASGKLRYFVPLSDVTREKAAVLAEPPDLPGVS